MKSRPPRRKNLVGPNNLNPVTGPLKLSIVIAIEDHVVAHFNVEGNHPAVTKLLSGTDLKNLKPFPVVVIAFRKNKVGGNGGSWSLERSHD